MRESAAVGIAAVVFESAKNTAVEKTDALCAKRLVNQVKITAASYGLCERCEFEPHLHVGLFRTYCVVDHSIEKPMREWKFCQTGLVRLGWIRSTPRVMLSRKKGVLDYEFQHADDFQQWE